MEIGLSAAALIARAFVVFLSIAAIGQARIELERLSPRAQQWERVEIVGKQMAKLEQSFMVALVVGVVTTVFLLITEILVIRWMLRAHRNLRSLGAKKLKATDKWVWLGWLIPIVNLFLPYMVMEEIARCSKHASSGHKNRSKVPIPIQWWWIAWVVGAIASSIGRYLVKYSDNPFDKEHGLLTLVFADVCWIAAAFLLMAVLRGVTEHQDAAMLLIQSRVQLGLAGNVVGPANGDANTEENGNHPANENESTPGEEPAS